MRALALERARHRRPSTRASSSSSASGFATSTTLDGARAHLEQAEQQAREEGDESSLANILLNRVIVETWAGDLGRAAELAERMVDAFGQHGVGPEAGDVWRAYVDAYAGRLESVREPPRRRTAGADRGGALEPLPRTRRARRRRDASPPTGTCRRRSRCSNAIDFREPAIWRVDGDAIEAALAAGELERAAGLVARFEERAARSRIPWSLAVSARCRGLLLAAQGELDAAAEALERALAEHERCPMPFERARTLLVQGQVQRRLKQKRQARLALERRAGSSHSAGAETWVDTRR